MIVSRSHEFIFIHVPKTAGSSVREALLPYSNGNPFWHTVQRPELGPGRYDRAHVLARDWRHFPYLNANRHFFVFAVKRNPYSRFISAYHQHLLFIEGAERGSHEWKQKDLNERMPDVLRHLRKCGPLESTIHLAPQVSFLFDGKKCLPDYIARYEALEEDVSVVFQIIGISETVGVKNTSPKGGKTLNFSQELLAEINETYKDDFTLLGYQACARPGEAADFIGG